MKDFYIGLLSRVAEVRLSEPKQNNSDRVNDVKHICSGD